MHYTYTEIRNEGKENEERIVRKPCGINEKIKKPMKIFIEIEIDEDKYEKRLNRYKESIWHKIAHLFGA